MGETLSALTGGLLGLAVGDALGYAVDSKDLDRIRRDYGPQGLQGYDLVNGYADVTSHTQLAAYTANGLLLGAARGRQQGKMGPFIRYVALAQGEWAWIQRSRRAPEKPLCWISRVPGLERRHCMDTRMPDELRGDRLATPEEPRNHSADSGSLTAAAAVGMFFRPERMRVPEIGRLGAEAVALTHGDPEAFLCGSALAYCLAGIVQDPQTSLKDHLLRAADATAGQFGREYAQALTIREAIYQAADLAALPFSQQVLEDMDCRSSRSVLCGAVYAVLATGEDLDAALVAAVNHSGRSAAVGAVAGAILGARLGVQAISPFYLEGLEPLDTLRTLAADLAQGCPSSRVFDDDWDRKYIQGEPVAPW